MYSTSTIPKRAFLGIRYQTLATFRDDTVAEVNHYTFARVHSRDILADPLNSRATRELIYNVPPFDHDFIRNAAPDKVFTYSGYLACHALWPFPSQEPTAGVDVLISVDEDERYRVARVEASRLVVACADVRFISPDSNDFVEVLARSDRALPHADVFENSSR